MNGIKVIYKPLLALKPAHIAIVGVLEQQCQSANLSERLPLPPVVLEHCLEELIFWQLVKREKDTIALTAQGKRCLAVWTATQSRGYWEFEDDGKWLLGEGTFQFADTLLNLHSVGLDVETGEKVSEADAMRAIKDQQSARTDSETYVRSGKCVEELKAAIGRGGSIEDALEAILDRTNSILDLNRVCEQLSCISDFEVVNDKLNRMEFLKAISRKKSGQIRQIQRQQRKGQRAVWVILAQWYRQNDGLLGNLACKCPAALRCVSTVGVPLWEEEKKLPAFAEGDERQPELANTNDGFLSWLGGVVSSVFR